MKLQSATKRYPSTLTYGTIGHYLVATARQVAFVLANFTAEESEQVPWFRVVAANGIVSSIKLGAVGLRQIKRLQAEGAVVNQRNKIEDFQVIAWFPR